MTSGRPAARRPRLLARTAIVVGLASAIPLLQAAPSSAATSYKLTKKISGLASPVYVAAAPGNNHRYFIVLKAGVIDIVDDWKLLGTPFLDISARVSSIDERGLL